MKYYLIAGEASGDLHGSSLMKELKQVDGNAEFRFFGGDLMQAVANNLVKHYREMAFMGLFDVLYNIRTIKKNMNLCKMDILAHQPDVLILIDYPGFNLRIAEFARKNGIKVFYFISPKIWAWKENRVKKIKAFVDEMFTILPFETDFYKKHNYKVHYVGNPLIGSIQNHKKKVVSEKEFRQKNNLDEKPIVALLAGSRIGEIKLMLPVMIAMKGHFPDFQFVISGAPSISSEMYASYLKEVKLPVVFDQTYELLKHSHSAIVTSGTATLEAAIFGIPQIMVYKFRGNKYIIRLLRTIFLKTKLFSLPNLILNEEAIKELVMEDMNEGNLAMEAELLLNNRAYRNKIFEKYARLDQLMGKPGAASRAALKMHEILMNDESVQLK